MPNADTPSNRRSLLQRACAGAAVLMASGASASAAGQTAAASRSTGRPTPRRGTTLIPDAVADQSAALQVAIDEAAIRGETLSLPAGRYLVRGIRLRPGMRLVGAGRRSVLSLLGEGPLLTGDGAHGLRLAGLRLEGRSPAAAAVGTANLVDIKNARDIAIDDLEIAGARGNGLALTGCSGRVAGSRISGAGAAGMLALDSGGLEIRGNHVHDCANNGILVWRSAMGDDGTLVTGNRVERIGAQAGGSGQNGNGVGMFRAGNVSVTGNRITDCAYSAVRANAASNVQIVGNSASRIGEVALYAEFGFEGALIAQNIVDGAASGISVTNFNEGGRLAVVQGNLIRNLVRREHESQDKRGEGITVEADASVSGNTIEGAPTAGIVVGWGAYLRDVAVTGNVIRRAGVGILVTRQAATGAALIAQNLISGAQHGGIRLMENGRPVGDDLALSTRPAGGGLTITGNVATSGGA